MIFSLDIEIRSDDLEALEIANRLVEDISINISYYDLVSTLHFIIKLYLTKIVFHHVIGNQDNNQSMDKLDI